MSKYEVDVIPLEDHWRVVIHIGPGVIQGWGSPKHEFPRTEKQLKKALEKARKVVQEKEAKEAWRSRVAEEVMNQ